jgi:hypothetical protein
MPLGFHKATLFGVAGVSTEDVVLLSSQTASNSATISFTSGIDSTYGEYIFKFYNINPATDGGRWQFQVNATDDPGGGYDTSLITSSSIKVAHDELDAGAEGPEYYADGDLAQSSSFQTLVYNCGNDADKSISGELHLFNPSSTTYVKHFTARMNAVRSDNYALDLYTAGYINDTTAIDDIQFKMASGNFDGTIKMWGIK